MAGYNRAMEEAKLPTDGLVATTPRPSSVSSGGELIGTILDRRSDLEALFCCDHNLALGALFECQRRGSCVVLALQQHGFHVFSWTHPGSCRHMGVDHAIKCVRVDG